MNEQETSQSISDEKVLAEWYTPLTRVTSLSKYLALVLFIALPFVGFWLGVGYGKDVNSSLTYTTAPKDEAATKGVIVTAVQNNVPYQQEEIGVFTSYLRTNNVSADSQILVISPAASSTWSTYKYMDIQWEGDVDPLTIHVVSRECYEKMCFGEDIGGVMQSPEHMQIADYVDDGFRWHVSHFANEEFPEGEYKLLFHKSAEGGNYFTSSQRTYYGESDYFIITKGSTPVEDSNTECLDENWTTECFTN